MESLFSKKIMEKGVSFPELVFPTFRKKSAISPDGWIHGKIEDDGAEGYWRIHNNLYDFSSFVISHPGGRSWLEMSKGLDITEAFESHHISLTPESMLSKYFVKKVDKPRNSPFTFKEDGFYRTLKANVRDTLKTIDQEKFTKDSEAVMDMLLLSLAVLLIFATTGEWGPVRILSCALSGLLMTWNVNCAHNFIHKKDSWRMNVASLQFLSVRDWRIGHAFSHHLYPNTLWDLEVYSFEPFFIFSTRKDKNILVKHISKIYAVLVFIMAVNGSILLRIISFQNKRLSKFEWTDLVPFMVPLYIFILCNRDIKDVLITWLVLIEFSSLFLSIINLHAAHHHPEIFHDGDIMKKNIDWGLFQMTAVADRVDVNKSFLMVMTHFGEHILHHLFPTLDHSILAKLHPVFAETCSKFKAEMMMTDQLDMFLGFYKQLARTEPKIFNNPNVEG